MPTPPLIEQAAAIPYRRTGEQLEFCLITSMRTGKWGFPKGIIDPGETPEQTALKEAHEEAGISGRIVGPVLGSYNYRKWQSELRVRVYLMEITKVDASWQEAALRKRRFCSAQETSALIEESRQFELFQQALGRLGAKSR